MQEKSKEILKEFAGQYHLDWRILAAILMKESNQQGYDDKGNLKKRLEKSILAGFRDVLLNIKQRHPQLPGLKANWIRAHNVDEIVMMSTSWGIAQIMGWQYPLLNYEIIDDMIDAWQSSEEIQIRDFCLFCVRYNNGKFLDALEKQNFQSIAVQYNGRGFAQNNYDKDLLKYFQAQK